MVFHPMNQCSDQNSVTRTKNSVHWTEISVVRTKKFVSITKNTVHLQTKISIIHKKIRASSKNVLHSVTISVRVNFGEKKYFCYKKKNIL